jgi:hypothetical protein
MPTWKGMSNIERAGTALIVIALVFGAPSVAAAATTTSTSSTSSTSTTSTTIPPNMPKFALPTDDGLKLLQQHNTAERQILVSQKALHPAQVAAARAQHHLQLVKAQLRTLTARAHKTEQQLAVARENLRSAAVQAYIHSGSADLGVALDALSSAKTAVDVGSQLQMIGAFGSDQKEALDAFVALKQRLDEQMVVINDRLGAATHGVEDANAKLLFLRSTILGAKQQLADSVLGMLAFHAAATSALSPILGPSRLSAKQMADYVMMSGAKPNITVPLQVLAQIYLNEGAKLGVRGDVAWAQSILETGGFAHPGSAADNNNFAGIGWCDTCKHGINFATAELGVRAQMQLLRTYVDPNFPEKTYKDKIIVPGALKLGFRGKVQTWWDLWGTWATGALYGQRVYDIYEKMVAFSKFDPDPPPGQPGAPPTTTSTVPLRP